MNSALEQEETLQIPYLDEESTEGLYSIAYEHFRQAAYKDALQLFRFLSYLYPSDVRYWEAQANTLQEMGNFEEAIEAYAMCSFLDHSNPYPFFHAAGCYFSLGKLKDAIISIKQAKVRAQKEKDALLLKHIVILQRAWKPLMDTKRRPNESSK